MFRPVPMVRLRVQVPARESGRATRAIAKAGLLHLVDIAHGTALPAAAPEPEELLPRFRALGTRLRRAAGRLGIAIPGLAGEISCPEADDLAAERARLEAALVPIEQEADAAWLRKGETEERCRKLATEVSRGRRLAEGGVPVERAQAMRFGAIRIVAGSREDLAGLGRLLAPAPFAIVPLETGGARPLAAVAVPRSSAERLEDALRLVPCDPFPLPAADAGGPAEERLRAAEAERHAAARSLAAKTAELREPIARLAAEIEVQTTLLEAQSCFAPSGRFVVISGWVPADGAATVVEILRAALGDRAVIDVEKPQDLPEVAEGLARVPILFRNPILLRPFQKLVGFYGTPAYGEVEPTPFFAASFLLMFGLMFGDVGHGFVLFLAGFLLFRHFPRFLDYGLLLMEAGAASAAFGVLYGSVFGLDSVLPVLWISPLRDIRRFLGYAAGLGVVLVSAGLVLNVINGWRSGNRIEALIGPRGLFGAFAYWVVLALIVRALVPGSLTVPAGALFVLLGLFLALLGARPWLVRRLRLPVEKPPPPAGPAWLGMLEGSVELVDAIIGYFANTLSFLRVAAFAAVHAGVFLAVFALANTMARLRFGGFLSAASLVAGNALVIVLEGLAVSVQVLRLEYYEFFGKFFRGGGEAYRPFKLRPSALKGETP